MQLTLVNKFATMTSRGVLSKAWYRGEDDKLYLVKGNSKEDRVIGYEPFSEVIFKVYNVYDTVFYDI